MEYSWECFAGDLDKWIFSVIFELDIKPWRVCFDLCRFQYEGFLLRRGNYTFDVGGIFNYGSKQRPTVAGRSLEVRPYARSQVFGLAYIYYVGL